MSESTVSNPSVASAEPAGKFVSALKGLILPAIDVGGIVQSRARDIDAFAAANDAALQGLQNLGHAQAEILKNTLAQAQTLLQRGSAEPGAGFGTVREALTQSVHGAVADVRLLAEASVRTAADIAAVIGRRVEESFRESAGRLTSAK